MQKGPTHIDKDRKLKRKEENRNEWRRFIN